MKKILIFITCVLITINSIFAQGNEEFHNKWNNIETVDVEIIATSDLHGWFVPWDFSTDTEYTRGSLTYIAQTIKEHRENNENLIYVDCGDAVQANYVEYFINDDKNPMVEAFNYLNCDVWTFGNHEYNFNRELRQNLIDDFEGTILSGNVYEKATGKRYLPATTVIEKDGIKIGFIGITTPLITEFENGKDSLDGLEIINPLVEIKKALSELKAENVDSIIGILHMGLDEENNIEGSGVKEIAKAFPEFDAIIAGHAHANISKEVVNDVLIMEPYKYGQAIGFVNLTFEKSFNGVKLINKDVRTENVTNKEDEKLVKLMEPYKKELRAFVNTPIGTLINSDLSKKDEIIGISSVYTESTGILNLLSAASQYYTDADVIILNTDAENAGFKVGNVSIKDISSSYTYSGGEITTYKITGADLKLLLEYSADYFNQIEDGDLTISYNPERRLSKYSTDNIAGGVTYTIDLTKASGSRIKDLSLITEYNNDGSIKLVNGKPVTSLIADDQEIILGTNSYSFNKWIGKGGSIENRNYTPIFNSFTQWGDNGTVRELTIRYIKEVLNGKINGDNYNINTWNIYTGVDKNSKEYKKAVELINSGKIELPKLENGRTNVKSISVNDLNI
ncbi:MAG: bifunctional metallophosphatase/5'-nucleotidase [Spirochaetia bacterium]|nr:bifunctional metallophosphatase/5'-nucleotidase [Spirochaetia bacterium]